MFSLPHIALSNHRKKEASPVARKKTTKSNKAKQTCPLNDLLGPPSILLGESTETYNDLLERVNDALKPTDVFEEFAALDLTNAMMDSVRFARLKPELLNANMHTGMQRVLKPLCNLSMQIKFDMPMLDADKVAAGWAMGEPNMVKIAEALLESGGLSMDAVAAETLSYEMDGFEAIDRLATNAEARRYTILREIERRREAKGGHSPVARVSYLATIDKAKANDNERLSDESDETVEVENEEVDTDGSSEATGRLPKATGE